MHSRSPLEWFVEDAAPVPSRRLLLQASLALPFVGCSFAFAAKPPPPVPVYFTAVERSFIEAATERLIPDGDDGLGARSAAVAFFIDRQLAGAYGSAAAWYLQGPWQDGTKQQGWQANLTPAQMYRVAIADIDRYCAAHHDGKAFSALAVASQDEVLHALEKGDVDLPALKAAHGSAKGFFDLLLHNTQEGFLSDPMYGGNRNFTGWRLIGFPGPRYNYVNEITAYGQPYKLPTVGLLGRNGLLITGA